MRTAACWVLLLVFPACSDSLPEAQFRLSTGHDANVFSAEPRVQRLDVTRHAEDGAVEPVGSFAPPAENEVLDIGMGRGETAYFEVEGVDSEGKGRVFGRSYYVSPYALEGVTLSLYVGRKGRFGRPYGEFWNEQGETPPVAHLGGRFLVTMGATAKDAVVVDGFDFGTWGTDYPAYVSCPVRNCRVESSAVVDYGLLVMLGDSWGAFANFSQGSQAYGELNPPAGLETFGLVSGGKTVYGRDGSAYVVGPTREEKPSQFVVRIGFDGQISAHQLAYERQGAAATWVEGRGLLVAGGSGAGAGAELLDQDTLVFEELDFAPDATTGSALFDIEARNVLRVGGRTPEGTSAPSVLLDATCSEACRAIPWGSTVDLDRVDVFRVDEESLLAVGTNAQGWMAARRITQDGLEQVSLREKRRLASVIQTSLGHVAVVGGLLEDDTPALGIELFTP